MAGIHEKLLLFPYTFVLMNWAAVAGLYYFARGSMGMWDSTGREARAQWHS